MFDFMVYSPEVNAFLMSRGPGSTPLWGAAEAWISLAEQLMEAAQEVSDTIVVAVPASFAGETSDMLASRVSTFVAWLDGNAENAGLIARVLHAVAYAFEEARAGMVPLLTVLGNIIHTMALKAINWFGQVSSTVAALEADYDLMWVQNSTAMTTYRDTVLRETGKMENFEPAPQLVSRYCMDRRDSVNLFDSSSSSDSLYESIDNLYDSVAQSEEHGSDSMSQSYNTCGSVAQSELCDSPFGTPSQSSQSNDLSATSLTQQLGGLDSIISSASASLLTTNSISSSTASSIMLIVASQVTETLGRSQVAVEKMIQSISSTAVSVDVAASKVVAGVGQAVSVGALRVPENWATASQPVMATAHSVPAGCSAITTAVSGPLEGVTQPAEEVLTASVAGGSGTGGPAFNEAV
nr:45 kDa protein [Mycobacterium leprae]